MPPLASSEELREDVPPLRRGHRVAAVQLDEGAMRPIWAARRTPVLGLEPVAGAAREGGATGEGEEAETRIASRGTSSLCGCS